VEVQTQVPQSGTKLRIQNDRQFDQQSGDSVLRVSGQSQDGSPVYDAAYVEVEAREADTVGRLIRGARSPQPEIQDKISQEVQAAFSSRLSGRDAHQVALIATQAIQQQVAQWLGSPSGQPTDQTSQKLERLAERFERAAGLKAAAPSFQGGDGQQQGQQWGSQQQSGQQSRQQGQGQEQYSRS
jgi:hypothetical protein